LRVKDQDFLLKDLLHAVYWFDEGLQAHLEASGWPRMSRTKSMIMINIADGVTRPIQIAANLGISRQAVHLALDELQQQGLLIIEPDPQDRRAKRVGFADDQRGRDMRNDALRSLHRIEKVLQSRIGPSLYRRLREAMQADWRDPVIPD
jgi:DNA-binding MarR family transcriptional regulator